MSNIVCNNNLKKNKLVLCVLTWQDKLDTLSFLKKAITFWSVYRQSRTYNFSTLQWCNSKIHSVENVLQILNCDFSWVSICSTMLL